jgi:hypothetical protein
MFWILIFVKFMNVVLCSLTVIVSHFFKGYCLNDKIQKNIFVSFLLFLINVLQSIYFVINIPFFCCTRSWIKHFQYNQNAIF